MRRITENIPGMIFRRGMRRPPLGEVITLRDAGFFDRGDEWTITRMPMVLVVEDSEAVAAATKQYLEATSFAVSLAIDGQLAVRMARELKPDLILMDIQLPKLDGLEAIRQIRACEALRSTPIVVVTGFISTEQIDQCRRAGADRFVAKPYRMADLVTTLRELLGVDGGCTDALDWEI
ncbi:MAG: response regulator [Planctomycetota bacterium]